MTFRVELDPEAKNDIREILRWIRDEMKSPAGAAALSRSWQNALNSLAEFPESHALAPENEHHREAIRQAIFKTRKGKPHRVVFTVQDNLVYVFRVRGPGQDLLSPEDLGVPE